MRERVPYGDGPVAAASLASAALDADDDEDVLAIGCDVVWTAASEAVMSMSGVWGAGPESGDGEAMRDDRLLVLGGSEASWVGTAVFVVETRDGLSVLAAVVGGWVLGAMVCVTGPPWSWPRKDESQARAQRARRRPYAVK